MPPHGPGLDWEPAEVPGTVAANLTSSGSLPDPYVDDNIRKFAGIEEQDWWYRGTFDAPAIGEGSRVRLTCHGLTVGAELWINGQPLGSSSNMWIPFQSDLTPSLRPESNEVLIRFPATIGLLETDGDWAGAMRRQPGSHLRTAQCLYGWDFVPRLPAVGIWRPIELTIERTVAIDDLAVTYTVDPDRPSARVTLSLSLESLRRSDCTIRVTWSVRRNGVTQVARRVDDVLAGSERRRVAIELRLDDVELWWPVGYGSPSLYQAVAEVSVPGYAPTAVIRSFGIRTVRLSEEPDRIGRDFSFEINGQRIFSRGANWTPPDLLTLDGTPDRVDRLLDLAVGAGMNMIRVWGGGIYGSERLYDRCDELGLLVWQDFMYACSAYPDHDATFVANARREAEWAVTTLRRHPSIVCWCGNNENEWIYSRLQASGRRGPGLPGASLFTSILPEVCDRLDGSRPYRQSTPFGGSRPNAPDEGSQHFYTVGLGVDDEGRFDFRWASFGPEAYENAPGRFIAEFGAYVGLPEPEALEAFLTPDERAVGSSSWRLHMPGIGQWPVTFQQIFDYQMTHLFGVMPQALDWDAYQDHARLVQGEALRIGFEAFRRNKPRTSGALMWSLNGVWPATDWALIDYHTVPKPAYWFAKRALAPSLVSLARSPGGVDAWVIHDGSGPLEGRLRLEYGDLRTGRRWQREEALSVDPDAAMLAYRLKWSVLPEPDCEETYVAGSLWRNGICLSRAVALRRSVRSAELPASTVEARLVSESPTAARIRVSTDSFAYAVRLSCYGATFSDNYFHLAPGEAREIELDLTRASTGECTIGALNASETRLVRFGARPSGPSVPTPLTDAGPGGR